MIELIKCVYKTKYSKYKSIKNMIKGLKIYVCILSMQDLIVESFRFRDEDDYEYEIFSMLSIARA